MNLRSSYPYFLLRSGLINSFPSLKKNIETDVAIIGAGISGSLMSYFLGEAGVEHVIVDRRHAGMGSTAASTSLLQYEIDTPLFKLIPLVGEKNAVRSYILCREAIHTLHNISTLLNHQVDFDYRPSFQFASSSSHLKNLHREMVLRTQYNISTLEWLSSNDIRERYGFAAPGGLLSTDGAQADIYRLCHALLEHATKKYNAQVFDNTAVQTIEHKKNQVHLTTDDGYKIKARYLMICAGYESQRYIPKRVGIARSTYAIASEPFQQNKFWHQNSLIWETSNPYLYLRTTADNRIIIGGKDDDFYDPEERNRRLPRKAKALAKAFHNLFPHLDFVTDFEWAGVFYSTKDGLPYIGSIPQHPNTYFALGFGGNGITFSVIAAQLLRDVLLGKQNPDQTIFSFDR